MSWSRLSVRGRIRIMQCDTCGTECFITVLERGRNCSLLHYPCYVCDVHKIIIEYGVHANSHDRELWTRHCERIMDITRKKLGDSQ